MPNRSGKYTIPTPNPPVEPRDVLREYERLTGLRVGAPGWEEAIHEEDRAAVLAEWKRAQKRGRFLAEYRLRFRDGHFRYVRGASFRKRCVLRDRWYGYIMPVEKDHPHRCESERCYCPNTNKSRR